MHEQRRQIRGLAHSRVQIGERGYRKLERVGVRSQRIEPLDGFMAELRVEDEVVPGLGVDGFRQAIIRRTEGKDG